MRYFEKDVVLAACVGRYNEIAMHFLPEMAEALKRPGEHVGDPFKAHKGKDGFRVFKDFNAKGYMVFNNNFGGSGVVYNVFDVMKATGRVKNFGEALELVGTFLGCERTGPYSKDEQVRKPLSEDQKQRIAEAQLLAQRQEELAKEQHRQKLLKARKAVEKQLENSVSLFSGQADEVWKYFENRGMGMLKNAPHELFDDLSYCPRCPYYDQGKLVGYYGALISKVRTTEGKLWSLHRTFLFNGAKAPVSCPKKLMPPVFDADGQSRFIKLGEVPAHGVIGIAEGLETALSAHIGMRIPVWSAVSSTFLAEFNPPKNVSTVLIFADVDVNETGQTTAKELRKKLIEQGLDCYIVKPKSEIPAGSKGIDWNDELRNHGVYAFPDPFFTMQFILEQKNRAA